MRFYCDYFRAQGWLTNRQTGREGMRERGRDRVYAEFIYSEQEVLSNEIRKSYLNF